MDGTELEAHQIAPWILLESQAEVKHGGGQALLYQKSGPAGIKLLFCGSLHLGDPHDNLFNIRHTQVF